MTAPQPIAPERLVDFAAAVYSTLGVPDLEARLRADSLVQADLWGHQSHGVLRLSWYEKRIESGAMKAMLRDRWFA